jgi:hypothetical protein
VNPLAIHWETTLTPAESGDYNLGVQGDGFMSLAKRQARDYTWDSTARTRLGRVSLEKGKPYEVEARLQLQRQADFKGARGHGRSSTKRSILRLLRRPKMPMWWWPW